MGRRSPWFPSCERRHRKVVVNDVRLRVFVTKLSKQLNRPTGVALMNEQKGKVEAGAKVLRAQLQNALEQPLCLLGMAQRRQLRSRLEEPVRIIGVAFGQAKVVGLGRTSLLDEEPQFAAGRMKLASSGQIPRHHEPLRF